MTTAQYQAPSTIDLTTPHRETSIWNLARALQEQWVNGQSADWSMVSEVLHRAIQAEPSSNQTLMSTKRTDDAALANCAVCDGTMLECSKCGHTGCNNQGVGLNRPYPCQNRIDLGSRRKGRCNVCECDDLYPASSSTPIHSTSHP
jgi:hypothetical protein